MDNRLIVRIPASRLPEHHWIVTTVLHTYLGLDAIVYPHDDEGILIMDSGSSRSITLPSILLTTNPSEWSATSAVPGRVPHWIDQTQFPWDSPQRDVMIPVLYVENDPSLPRIEESSIHFPWDFFGSAFFMLTRLEEILLEDKDEHGRFPAVASLAVKEGFERIPVVNAWGEILWGAIQHLWPNLERKQHTYRTVLSHDVDSPLVSNKHSLPAVIRASAGDMLIRKSTLTGIRRLLSWCLPESLRPNVNPGNTFDFIMRESERRDLKSAFYFIPENTAGRIDGTYTLDMPFIQQQLLEIHDRGHEIGLHPGYMTSLSQERIQSGFDALRNVTDKLGIRQEEWGGRQHYLRWNAAETWRLWDSAGLSYDSTVGYAETVGFRAGACFDYPVFDVIGRKELSLIERPLIIMEGSLFSTTSTINLALSDSEGLEILSHLAHSVQAYNGNFTLLWHNSSLITKSQRQLYRAALDEALRPS